MSKAIAWMACAGLLAGCVTRSADVAPRPAADDAALAVLPCPALWDEADRVRQRAARTAYAVDERAGTNIVALGVGVTVFWPALIAMRPAGNDAEELARLKGRDDALRRALAARGCPPAPLQLAPERAAALPVGLGERLVYEERAAAGGAARTLVLRLVALQRDALEFAVDLPTGAGAPERWRQDRVGNQPDDVAGWVHWRRLLEPDLALGDVLAGDLIGPDPRQRGRVRGQVVALGVRSALGRPFDAAVIELYGDVPQADHSTRLTGSMVVDRKSGVLLRLDLDSGNPAFALKRTLLRIEPADPAR